MLSDRSILILVMITCSSLIPSTDSKTGGQLARRKRYVVFPEGSSFSIALCLTMHTLTPDNIFTEGVNWGISYDLPNESKPELDPFLQLRKDSVKPSKYLDKYDGDKFSGNYKPNDVVWNNEDKLWTLDERKKKKKYTKADYHYLQRRYRRDLYNKMETVINAMGFDGRSCILRALCEASQKFMPKGNTLVEEMIRIVFSVPLKRVFNFEPSEHHEYVGAHRAGHEGRDCVSAYPGCSFSLLDMALGKYDAPDDDYNDYSDDTNTNGLPPYLRYIMK